MSNVSEPEIMMNGSMNRSMGKTLDPLASNAIQEVTDDEYGNSFR